MVSKNKLGNIGNARTEAQREHMEKTVCQGKCPFCDLDLILNKIVYSWNYWRAWKNPFHYPNHQEHIVIASLAHWTNLREIPPDAWAEWGLINATLIEAFNLPGGGLVLRFGDNSHNAGTLEHMHSHIQVPDKTGPAVAVFFKDETLAEFLKNSNK